MPVAPARCAVSRMPTARPSSTARSPRSTTTFSRAPSSAARSAGSSWSSGTTVPSTAISSAAVTVTVTPCGDCAATAASGSATSLPWLEITLLVTMKMISSTRKMSVSGVMLISATMSSPVDSSALGREWMATADLLGAHGLRGGPDVEQRLHEPLGRARPGRAHVADLHLQEVVEGERHDRDAEADRGRDQRLRDARGDDREAARALDRDLPERLHDADHGAEQPDEGRQRADRAEQPEPAPQIGDRLLAGRREDPLEVLERDVLPREPFLEDLAERRLRG